MLLPNVSSNAARVFAEDIRHLIEAQPFELAGARGPERRTLTVSAGVSALRADDEFDGAILRRADDALYAAKRTRNTVMCA